jgi:NitT/TauT family transport system substrate-binding protein
MMLCIAVNVGRRKGADMAENSRVITRRGLLERSAGLAAALAIPAIRPASAADSIKLSLEFRIYGANAPMFYGAETGIFRNLDIEPSFDGSAGSGDSLTRVASGTHTFGFSDASAVVEFAAQNPDAAPKVVMTIFDRFPAVVLSLKRKPIKTAQDLVGARIGTGIVDAGAKILPALLALNKIDPSAIHRVTTDVKLREAIIGFDYTASFNLVDNGVKLDDINLLYFSDFGFDFPGNSLIASPATIAKNPDLVRRMALAVARSWVASARDRAGAIAAVTKRDRLLIAATERARMDWVIDKLVETPSVRANGLGYAEPKRLAKGIDVLKEGFQLKNPPTVAQVFDDRFLPPVADRTFG